MVGEPAQSRILITDGETRAALAAVRGLDAAGFHVTAASAASARPAPSQWSRATQERLIVPHPLDDESGFVTALESELARRSYAVLIAGSDASLLAISGAREKLAGSVALGLPPHDIVERALDKRALMSAASEHGLASPESIACSSSVEGLDAARSLGFPVLIKPVCSIVELGSVRSHVGSMRATDEQGVAAAIAASGDSYIVQRTQAGPVLSFAGVYARGETIGEAFSRYIRTWYPDAGNVSFSETLAAPPELRARVGRLLEGLRWEGLFELELIGRAEGDWAAIDFNPRPYGSLALAIGAGANLPAMWCRLVLGEHVEPVRARPGVRYRWEDADARNAVWQLRHMRLREAARALSIHRGVVHPYFRLRDPGPFAARLLFLAKAVPRRLSAPPPQPPKQDVRDASIQGALSPARERPARVVIIGAGPHGLAAAAHLRAAGVPTDSFGEPLEFWRRHMPAGMLLRSPRRATNIADPSRELSIDRYEEAEGKTVRVPTLRLEEFVDYGIWFQRRAVPNVDPRKVKSVARDHGMFVVTLEDREELVASRVVVAAGLCPFAAQPEPFAELPPSLVSHTRDHPDMSRLAGQRVAVIGAGQSALETAALLAEHGATVEVLARAPAVRWLADDTKQPAVRPWPARVVRPPPTGVGGRMTGWIAAVPDTFRHAPGKLKRRVTEGCMRPAGSGWLRPRLSDVPITCGCFVTQAQEHDGHLKLALDDGSQRSVDHVLLGTGYAVDIARYEFLRPIAHEIQTRAGYPVLWPGLESSVPGLHFLGAPAALSFGPIMNFVVGSWYDAPALTLSVLGRSQRPIRKSF